ncbi:hypothetical protein HDU96_002579 [Phlyctochytrium bullatum]|nr:hypothetical protein HDU96_002579 [Phlyctochytrium bullatum]
MNAPPITVEETEPSKPQKPGKKDDKEKDVKDRKLLSPKKEGKDALSIHAIKLAADDGSHLDEQLGESLLLYSFKREDPLGRYNLHSKKVDEDKGEDIEDASDEVSETRDGSRLSSAKAETQHIVTNLDELQLSSTSLLSDDDNDEGSEERFADTKLDDISAKCLDVKESSTPAASTEAKPQIIYDLGNRIVYEQQLAFNDALVGSLNPSMAPTLSISPAGTSGSSIYTIATLSLPCESVVELRSNGNIIARKPNKHIERLKWFNKTETAEPPFIHQFQNISSQEGAMAVYKSNGSCSVLFPNGNTSERGTAHGWVSTNQKTGASFLRNLYGTTKELPSLRVVNDNGIRSYTSSSTTDVSCPSRVVYVREDLITTTIGIKPVSNPNIAESERKCYVDVTTEYPDSVKVKTRYNAKSGNAGFDYDRILECAEASIFGPSPTKEASTGLSLSLEKSAILGLDPCGRVTLKENGAFAKIEFGNGTVLQRRVNLETKEFTIQYIKDDLRLELDSSGHGKLIARPLLTSDGSDLYEFNWLKGTIQTIDETKTKFVVNSDGSYQSRKISPANSDTERNERPSLVAPLPPSTSIVSSLVRGERLSASINVRNPPRLFVLEEDGSGLELLRDTDLIPFLRREYENPDSTIVEEPSEDDPNIIHVNVVTKLRTSDPSTQQPLVTYRVRLKELHINHHACTVERKEMGRRGSLLFCNCLFWSKVTLALILAVSGLAYLSWRVYDLRRFALDTKAWHEANPPRNESQSIPIAIPTQKDGSVSSACFHDNTRLARLEPDSSRMMMGFHLDWSTDNPTAITNRLRQQSPAVINAFMKIDMNNATMPFDFNSLRWHGYEVQKIRGILELTLEPISDIAEIPDELYDNIAKELRDINADKGVPVLLRYGHEMNGDWVLAYGYRPIAYKNSFRKMANAVRRLTNLTAMVWAPNVGIQYPFSPAPGDKSAPKPRRGTDEFNELDTDGNGEIASGDDPYLPFYPGDEYVDWVGLSIYFYPLADNDLVQGRANLNVEIPGQTYLRQQLNLENLENQVPTPPNTTFDKFKAMLDFYTRFCVQRNKPMMIPETGAPFMLIDDQLQRVPSRSGELAIKQAWWQQVWSPETMAAWPKLKLVVQFEESKWQHEKFQNWAVTNASTSDVLPAFNKFIEDSRQNLILGKDMRFKCDGSIVL